jgi:hypothetical protein
LHIGEESLLQILLNQNVSNINDVLNKYNAKIIKFSGIDMIAFEKYNDVINFWNSDEILDIKILHELSGE